MVALGLLQPVFAAEKFKIIRVDQGEPLTPGKASIAYILKVSSGEIYYCFVNDRFRPYCSNHATPQLNLPKGNYIAAMAETPHVSYLGYSWAWLVNDDTGVVHACRMQSSRRCVLAKLR